MSTRKTAWCGRGRARLGLALGLAVLAACAPAPPLLSPDLSQQGVVFRYRDPVARVVQLAGSWEGNLGLRGLEWTSNSRVGIMERRDDGTWELRLDLGPGRYEYLFLVDGRFWELDPANPQRCADGAGAFVSLLVVP